MFPKELIPYVLDFAPTGSRAIVTPPPMDTDEDWVVLVPKYSDFTKVAKEAGFTISSSEEYRTVGSNDFKAYRRGELNLIVSVQKTFFHRYVFATRLAAALNLKEKDDRIILFHMVRDLPTGVCY